MRDNVIESAVAVRFDGYVEQGRTGPLRVHVETENGDYVDVILKMAGPQLPLEGLANEMLGSLLAGDLNIPTPQPYFGSAHARFYQQRGRCGFKGAPHRNLPFSLRIQGRGISVA